MNKKIQLSFGIMLSFIAFLGLFVLAFAPHPAKADFFDDFVDFLDPTQHIGNIIDGRPQDNLPPIPGFSGGNDSTTVNYYVDNHIQTCYDPSATNYGGVLPCRYPVQTCQDPSATNYGGTLPCRYPVQTCQDPSAINYRGALPCVYHQVCQDYSAINYRGELPCRYPVQTCQDPSAINYRGDLPCRYQNYNQNVTVSLRADDTNIDSGDSTRIRWTSDNADYCTPSGGTNDWNNEDINTSGSFNTDDLTRDETFRITCYNNNDSANDSVTIRVDDNNDNNDDAPEVTTRNATNVSTSSATLNGRADGNGSTVRAWFEYGPNTNFGYTTSQNSYGSGSTDYSRSISGLIPNTTYYFRAVAENSRDTDYGSILSFNTANDFVVIPPPTVIVRPPTIITTTSPTPRPAATALVLLNSSLNSNQPIVPTLDNARPHPGDEINYTVSYQNIGTGAITGVTLQIALPQEVNYMFSIPSNPNIFGNTLIFNLGTLKANGQGTVTVRTRVLENIPAGVSLNFPAILSYIDPSGSSQSVTANVSAQVWSEPVNVSLEANVVGAGFLPTNLFGWLLLLVLVLTLVLLAKYLFGSGQFFPLSRQTVTTYDPSSSKQTTTTTTLH